MPLPIRRKGLFSSANLNGMQLARLTGLLVKLGGLLVAFEKVIFIPARLPVRAGHDPALIGPADRISSVLSWFLFYNLWRPFLFGFLAKASQLPEGNLVWPLSGGLM
jgi:hypothetical protein